MRRGNEPSKDRVPAGHWTGPIDMAHAFNNLAFDIMTSVSFDSEFDTMGSPEYRYAMQAIEDSNVRLGVLIQAPELNFAKMDRKLFPKALVGRYKSGHVVDKHVCRLSLSHGFVQLLPPSRGGGPVNVLSVDEIRMGPKLNSCAFLRACIDESLRMSPPGGSALWREVEDGGALIDGTFIPERTEIAVGVYSIHHSPAYYNDPFCYDPDRWYRPADSKGARNESSRLPYMPFSVGARSCVGKPLAIAQIMIVFARLIWEFDLRRADSDFDWMEKDCTPTEYALRDHLTAWKEGPILSIRPRFSD
ncbi:hypothetical protein RJ55_04874 [Drechmeria coniospora]|nr:hypothetical protein RJ55_04874 [Drechmeria coniospora]